MATDLTTYESADEAWDVYIKDSSGDAIDITGYTFLFTVKKRLSDSDDDAIIKKVITSHPDPTGGKTKIIIDSADTVEKNGKYLYDFQWIDNSTMRKAVLKKAKFIIEQRVGDDFT